MLDIFLAFLRKKRTNPGCLKMEQASNKLRTTFFFVKSKGKVEPKFLNFPNAPNVWKIYLRLYHKFKPKVGNYSIHGASGFGRGSIP